MRYKQGGHLRTMQRTLVVKRRQHSTTRARAAKALSQAEKYAEVAASGQSGERSIKAAQAKEKVYRDRVVKHENRAAAIEKEIAHLEEQVRAEDRRLDELFGDGTSDEGQPQASREQGQPQEPVEEASSLDTVPQSPQEEAQEPEQQRERNAVRASRARPSNPDTFQSQLLGAFGDVVRGAEHRFRHDERSEGTRGRDPRSSPPFGVRRPGFGWRRAGWPMGPF